jgi:hypothetical protein
VDNAHDWSIVRRFMRAFRPVILIVAAFLSVFPLSAQTPAQVVQWSSSLTPATVAAGKAATANLTATIKDGWHVYAITQPPGGPKGVTVRVPEGQGFKASGAVTGTKPKTAFDHNFNMNTEFYEKTATLQLPVTFDAGAAAGPKKLKVDVRFQTCNERLCLPPTTAHLEVPATIKH